MSKPTPRKERGPFCAVCLELADDVKAIGEHRVEVALCDRHGKAETFAELWRYWREVMKDGVDVPGGRRSGHRL